MTKIVKDLDTLWIDFLNSRWTIAHPPFRDGLLDSHWLAGLAAKHGLTLPTEEVAEPVRAEMFELRRTLAEAVDELEREATLGDATVAALNRWLRGAPVCLELTCEHGAFRSQFRSVEDGWPAIWRRIVASFCETMVMHEPRRIKKCGNPACGWVVYDASKNATRRWCGNTCASLMKVRRFRCRREVPSGT